MVKGKLFGFALAVVSMATIGLVQLQSEASTPGQVGSAPVCKVNVEGQRSKAFTVREKSATIKFTVTGAKNCQVRVSGNSFYAPSMDGKPYNKQELFDRVTKVLTPGSRSITVAVPTKSTPAKGCYYQLDLTYGTHNVTPVLAYAHGKIDDCGKQEPPTPEPAASCVNLEVQPVDRTSFRFKGQAAADNKATISDYSFDVYRGATLVDSVKVATSSTSAEAAYSQQTPGTYTVRLAVTTSEGKKTAPSCEKPLTVAEPPKVNTPGVSVEKLVNDEKYIKVGVKTIFQYQISVTNTGNTDLSNVAITDTPDAGVELATEQQQGSVTDNVWNYTIPRLSQNETMRFVLEASVPTYQAGRITNTVCVDTPDVTGTPDDCDTADVEPEEPTKPGEVTVCDPETGKIITVDKADADNYVAVNSPECEDEPVVVERTAKELPATGPLDTIAQLFGMSSLAVVGAYYLASRRL